MVFGLSKSVLNLHKNAKQQKSRNGVVSSTKRSTPCTPSQATDRLGPYPTPKQYPNLDHPPSKDADVIPKVSSFAQSTINLKELSKQLKLSDLEFDVRGSESKLQTSKSKPEY